MMESISLGDDDESDADWVHEAAAYAGTPDAGSPSDHQQHAGFSSGPAQYDHDISDAERDEEYPATMPGELAPKKKTGAYHSHIEQILYENPEEPIRITNACKSVESGGKYIVYTIVTGKTKKTKEIKETGGAGRPGVRILLGNCVVRLC